ncbi:lysophospholipid acyltransferase family protein [Mucilaginibacter sp.]|uniref:lysophospholipid acyltransferase family protein n=1 Tax=Mucilaginibacter sp. TaxID=1882438 RepID=UPI00261D4352|nr:lysophospholipid acyltransferase family protein [Mucilaginibacter sp.]MDB5031177.1 lauroyl acyltransferase [Mucilaginibacter sp.]
MIGKWLSKLGAISLSLVSLLPFWLLYVVSDILFIFLYYIFSYRKAVVRENLRNAFPEKSEMERLIIERKYFEYLADLAMETIKCISISKKEVQRRMVPTNPELMQYYFSKGKSIIAAAGHYCNWEMATLSFGFLTDKRRVIVYKTQSNIVFNDFFNRTRSRFGATMVAMKQALRKMIEHKNELTFTVLVSDQTPASSEVNYFTMFLNQPTAVFLGIEKLTKVIDCVVIFYRIDYIKRGYYTYTLVPLVENPKQTKPYEITNIHVRYLETLIREKPQYWLWSHRRWKKKPEIAI